MTQICDINVSSYLFPRLTIDFYKMRQDRSVGVYAS